MKYHCISIWYYHCTATGSSTSVHPKSQITFGKRLKKRVNARGIRPPTSAGTNWRMWGLLVCLLSSMTILSNFSLSALSTAGNDSCQFPDVWSHGLNHNPRAVPLSCCRKSLRGKDSWALVQILPSSLFWVTIKLCCLMGFGGTTLRRTSC